MILGIRKQPLYVGDDHNPGIQSHSQATLRDSFASSSVKSRFFSWKISMFHHVSWVSMDFPACFLDFLWISRGFSSIFWWVPVPGRPGSGCLSRPWALVSWAVVRCARPFWEDSWRKAPLRRFRSGIPRIVSGWVHPSYVCGHCPHLSHWNHQGCGPHLRFVGWAIKYI